jgi:uncharacterized protein YjbJ (UPF0337 family)
MTSDRVENKTNEAAGIAREMVGKISGNEQMEADGRIQKSKARLQETLGKVSDKLRAVKKKVG